MNRRQFYGSCACELCLYYRNPAPLFGRTRQKNKNWFCVCFAVLIFNPVLETINPPLLHNLLWLPRPRWRSRRRRSEAAARKTHDGRGGGGGGVQGNQIPAARVTAAAAAAPVLPAHIGVQGNQIPAARVAPAAAAPVLPAHVVKRAAGADGAELRAWQLAMLELARRHSVLQVGIGVAGGAGRSSQPCSLLTLYLVFCSEHYQAGLRVCVAWRCGERPSRAHTPVCTHVLGVQQGGGVGGAERIQSRSLLYLSYVTYVSDWVVLIQCRVPGRLVVRGNGRGVQRLRQSALIVMVEYWP